MELKYNKLNKILEAFYEHPDKKFTVRALAKITRMPSATAQVYLKALKKDGLVTVNNETADTILLRIKKINYFVEKIVSSGLLDCIIQTYHPSCVILFGSIRKGDSTYESDLDLFVESVEKKELKIERFETALKHKIQLFIEKDINQLPPQLFNNVVNGIKLFGVFKLK